MAVAVGEAAEANAAGGQLFPFFGLPFNQQGCLALEQGTDFRVRDKRLTLVGGNGVQDVSRLVLPPTLVVTASAHDDPLWQSLDADSHLVVALVNGVEVAEHLRQAAKDVTTWVQ